MTHEIFRIQITLLKLFSLLFLFVIHVVLHKPTSLLSLDCSPPASSLSPIIHILAYQRQVISLISAVLLSVDIDAGASLQRCKEGRDKAAAHPRSDPIELSTVG